MTTDNTSLASIEETELEEEKVRKDDESEFLDDLMAPFNPSKIDIVVEPKPLDAIIERLNHNEIDMNTDFQRHADLWDNQKMSRLIESILIRFPLPAFYFDASNDDNWLIVDGLQRLSAIRKFVVEKKLRLSGMEFLTELNGMTYDHLHRKYQRRIKECSINTYMIKPGTPKEVKYSIFRRINTGGLTLNNQEIRNALSDPHERQLLEKLANFEYTKYMLGNLSKRMKDQELVLRFWAFFHLDFLQHKGGLSTFLDDAMGTLSSEENRQTLEHHYHIAIKRCYELFGSYGFEKTPASSRRAKSASLFEVLMVCMAELSEESFTQLTINKAIIKHNMSKLLDDSEFANSAFLDSITYSTYKTEHVEQRYKSIRTMFNESLILNSSI